MVSTAHLELLVWWWINLYQILWLAVKRYFFIIKKNKYVFKELLFIRLLLVKYLQGVHYFSATFSGMDTFLFMFLTFMIWTAPRTTNTMVLTARNSKEIMNIYKIKSETTAHTSLSWEFILNTQCLTANTNCTAFWLTNLSSHCVISCLSSEFLGYCLPQNWHSDGSSDTAFSTARFLVADTLLISVRQLGHVAVSSRKRASARTWVKHPAHIKWPLVHCNIHN